MPSLSLKSCVKSAWILARKNYWLWIFGFFIGSSFVVFDFDKINLSNIGEMSLANLFALLNDRIGSVGISYMLILGAFVFSFFTILSILSRVSMLFGLSRIIAKEKSRFGCFFKKGLFLLPKVLAVEVILALPLAISLSFAVVAVNKSQEILFLVAVVLLALYGIFINLFKHYVYCFAVIENLGPLVAISTGWKFFKSKFKNLILAKLLEWGLWIILGAGSLLVFVLAFLPFILLGVFMYFWLGSAAFDYLMVLAVIFLAGAFFLVKGFCVTFIQSFLTNVYLNLK